MSREYNCRKCGGSHLPPTGKKCSCRPDNDQEEQSTAEQLQIMMAMMKNLQAQVTGISAQVDEMQDHQLADNQSSVAEASPLGTDHPIEALASATQPTPSTLREDKQLQHKVKSRMAELHLARTSDSDDSDYDETTPKQQKKKKGKKSGRARTADDFVTREIDWPHYYIYRGTERKPAKYEDLSVQEFVCGYLASILRGKESESTRKHMLTHLHELMLDATDFPWPNVRNYHAVLLNQFEMDRVTWEDTDKIQQLRHTYAHRVHVAKPVSSRSKSDIKYCAAYQTGTCEEPGDHQTSKGLLKHICAHCLRVTGIGYGHPEEKCRRKRSAGKNDPADQ